MINVVSSRLPPRALWLVAEWAVLHQDELRQAWARAKKLERERSGSSSDDRDFVGRSSEAQGNPGDKRGACLRANSGEK
jgi:hypothetical protein